MNATYLGAGSPGQCTWSASPRPWCPWRCCSARSSAPAPAVSGTCLRRKLLILSKTGSRPESPGVASDMCVVTDLKIDFYQQLTQSKTISSYHESHMSSQC